MRIAIMITDSNGRYPVPASKGGAISTLVEHFLKNNETQKLADLSVVTYYDNKAYQMSKKYKNTEFIWIRIPKIVNLLDKLFLEVICIVFPKKKALSFMSVFSLIYYTIKAHVILKNQDFDKVIIENNMIAFNMLRGLEKKYEGKYYLHLHNIPRTAGFAKKIIQNCTAVLCVSNYVGNQIAKHQNSIGPIERERIKTFYNCIDIDKFYLVSKDNERLAIIRDKYKINVNDFVIIYAGRLSPEKGIDRLLEATAKIEDSRVVVFIIGSYTQGSDFKDAYLEKLRSLAANQSVRVEFTGYIDNDELVYYYNVADIVILPSTWDEPAGLTMVEAMACGSAVITTNVGGIPEYVGSDAIVLTNGHELSSRISDEIVKALEEGINDDLCRLGKKRVENNFSNKNYLKRLIDILNV